jgi:hypothetical protein
MGSKTATASGGSKGGGMGPMQSMAMAGNTGLAGMSEAQANVIQKGLQNINKATGGDRDTSFQAIGQNIGEVGSKYRRPVDVEKTVSQYDLLNRGIEAGGKIVTGPDGIPRLQFGNNVVRNAQGQQMASMMIPRVYAQQPSTLGQFLGDVGRGISGYNTLQYQPGATTPTMTRVPGMADALAKLMIPGGITLGIAKDLFSRLFPGQEEEEQGTVNRGFAPEGFTFPADVPQRSIEETAGPTVDLRTPTIEELTTTPVTESGDFTRPGPTIDEYLSAGYGGQRMSPEQQNLIDEIQYEPKPNIFGLTDEGTYEVGPNLIGVGPEMGIFNDPFDRSSGYTPGLQTYRDNLIAQGISPEQADQMTRNLAAYGYKDGGLTDTVPPKQGPMSEGVASLFKNK